ncbi:MAG: hypothetical protein QXI16_00035 [Sulfolobaceae archaeon]
MVTGISTKYELQSLLKYYKRYKINTIKNFTKIADDIYDVNITLIEKRRTI